MSKKQNTIFWQRMILDLPVWVWVVIFCCVILLSIIQYVNFFIPDGSWLMEAARRFLKGGSYYHDFFESNPPLIIYFSILPVVVSQWLHISDIVAYRVLVGLMVLLTFSLCHYLLYRVIGSTRSNFRYFLLISIVFTLIVMPSAEGFGQREHLTTILVLPYFLLMAARCIQHNTTFLFRSGSAISLSDPVAPLELHTHISAGVVLLISLMAAIGFSIKPYFFAAFILAECYHLIRQRRWLAWWRIETVVCGLFVCLYLWSIWIFTPTYIQDILPILRHFYFMRRYAAWGVLYFNTLILTFIIAWVLFAFVIWKKYVLDVDFYILLMLAATGFFVSYAMQGKSWYYHIYPMVVFSAIVLCGIGFQALQLNRRLVFVIPAIVLITLIIGPVKWSFYFSFSIYRKRFVSTRHHSLPASLLQIISYLQKHASGQYIYFFANGGYPLFTVADYYDFLPASRYPGYWMLPTVMRMYYHRRQYPASFQKKIQAAQLLLWRNVTDDFKRYSPKVACTFNFDKWYYYSYLPKFDYIEYFSQYPPFRRLWKKYYRFGKHFYGYNCYIRVTP